MVAITAFQEMAATPGVIFMRSKRKYSFHDNSGNSFAVFSGHKPVPRRSPSLSQHIPLKRWMDSLIG